jgi:2-methylcitrate dehydratase PrpD
VDPSLDAMFSAMVPARVFLSTDRGRYERTVIIAKGDATNPMTRDELRQKFTTLTNGLISSNCADALAAALDALYEGNISLLNQALRTPFDAFVRSDTQVAARRSATAQRG